MGGLATNHEDLEQILETCLESIHSGQESLDSVLQRYPDAEDELRRLLETALWLDSQKQAFAPPSDFVAHSRLRLLARLEREQAASRVKAKQPLLLGFKQRILSLFAQKRFVYQFALTAILLACFIVSSSGIAVAAQWSIPGDALYPVKASLEDVQLALAFSATRRAELHIQYAEHRLVEIQNLVVENRFEYLHDTVSEFEVQGTAASTMLQVLDQNGSNRAEALADQLEGVLQEQSAIYPVLLQVAPEEAKAEIERLIVVANGINEDAQDIGLDLNGTLTPTPSPTGFTATPGSPTALGTVALITPLPEETPPIQGTPSPGTEAVTTSGTVVPPGTPGATTVGDNNGLPEPTITDESVIVTEEPKKTKKPLPNPTRRPPRPTKKP